MRVLLSTYGSRGDVEPMAGLAVALQALGAEARVCAPADVEFENLLARAGVSLAPAFSPVREWAMKAMANREKMDFPKRAAEIISAQYEAISSAAIGCDLIVATGLFPSTAAAKCVSEKLGIPYIYAAYCPYFVPSTHHRPHEYPGKLHPQGVTDNRVLWELDIQNMNALFGGAFNNHRAMIGLPAVENVRDYIFTDHPLLASDPVLGPWKPTDLRDVTQTGAWILPDSRLLPDDLTAFLQAGPKPIYVGFGSMPMHASKDAANVAIDAVRSMGRRMLLSRGWADLALTDDGDDFFIIGDINQQALFGRVAAVVHHGGAGTTTTAARSGTPQVVVPQIADQPYWAARVADLGIGVAHDGPIPSVASLAGALEIALTTETRERAMAVAQKIRGDGAMVAAKLLLESVSTENRGLRDHA
ncbi:glycosyltransferase [Phyllobacterium sp. YR531]|uniref:glycosyltransferase n=1 Tax=Phyllobacterium sp. YR531 TaxID=1144343 RepID=UPI00026F6CF8|nr:glycosyltransferase [Phyllobacterium sp. YR531]EJN01621.1 glycosyl transferase, UDP-glucuronosyltransferase [Phyllobacterium sp. YR531]